MRGFLIAILLIFVAGNAVADKIKDVRIVDIPEVKAEVVNSTPIAVEGEVTLSGPVEATITNTPTVNVASMPAAGGGFAPYAMGASGQRLEVRGGAEYKSMYCYFDVPAGHLLKIERVSGYTYLGTVIGLNLLTDLVVDDGDANVLHPVPRQLYDPSNGLTTFEAQGSFYVRDTNKVTSQSFTRHDLQVRISIEVEPISGINLNSCEVVGQLYPDPL